MNYSSSQDDADLTKYFHKRIEYFNIGMLMKDNQNIHLIDKLHDLHFELLDLEKNLKMVETYKKKFETVMKQYINTNKIQKNISKSFSWGFHPERYNPAQVLNCKD